MISTLVGVAFLGATITGAMQGVDALDKLVVTHTEFHAALDAHHQAEHPSTVKAIGDLRIWNRCDRLERRLGELEERAWRLRQSPTGDTQALREIELDLAQTKRQFDALHCAQVLAS